MRPNRALELGTGLFVLLGFAALFFLTTQLPASGIKIGSQSGYHVVASFDNIGDLKNGSPVSMAGVRIGNVEAVSFDAREFKAVARLRIDSAFANKIPDDSDASIQTSGLLGGKYVGISAGGSETFLKEGSQIQFTQSAIVLESLINKFFANLAGKSGGKAASDKDASSATEKAP